MAQPLRSLPPQIKKAPLVVPSRRVKFVRVEVIKASLLIRTTTVHYIIGAAWSNVRSLWGISGHCRMSERCPLYPQKRTLVEHDRDVRIVPQADSCTAAIDVSRYDQAFGGKADMHNLDFQVWA